MAANELDLEKLSSVFETLLRPPVAEMKEIDFRTYFLPFLTRQPIPQEVVERMLADMSRRTGAKHTQKDLIGNMLNLWITKIGSPYYACNVLDNDGTILFQVPPLFSRDELLNENDNNRLPILVEQASNQANVLPVMGTNYIKSNILPLFLPATSGPEVIEAWNKIYRYYNLPLIGSENPESTKEVDKQQSNENNEDVVEEYSDDDWV